jgi:LacI family transcriptional regulator
MPQSRKPRQSDVARLAGVSQAMVSYVLNSTANITIPDETRQRILDAIQQLGYIPDRSARSLRTRKTRAIAVMIPDITNPYHPAFARGAQDAAEQYGYDLLIYNTDGVYQKELSLLDSALQNHVDGIIGAFQHLKLEDMQRLFERGIAVVLTEWYPHPGSIFPVTFVCVDNIRAAWKATGYLVERGHRRIAFIAGIPGSPPSDARLTGYQQILKARGLPSEPSLVQPGYFSIEGGAEGMRALLQLPAKPDAVFASNDLSAIGAIQTLQQAGLRIPQDIAVIGFDDIPAATIVRPQLTTIQTFQKEIGARAAQVLIQQIENGLPARETRVDMPFELIARETA